MATALTMPKLGLTMTEGTVTEWLAEDGARVEKGQPVVVVTTDKIAQEVEAPAPGTLRIMVPPEEACQVTKVLAFILEPGESLPQTEEAAAAPAEEARPEGEKPAPAAAATAQAQRVRSSPAARRLARELGVEISQVPGSGRNGRISEADVQRFYDEQQRATAAPAERPPAKEGAVERLEGEGVGPAARSMGDGAPPKGIPLTTMRRAIATTMMDSLHSMAQLTLVSRADVVSLTALRELLRQEWDVPISYTDLIVKAVAVALGRHPFLNSTLVGDEIVLHEEVNIGVAVALEQGLIVPVVREADKKSVREIHHTLRDLAERARDNQLAVDEVTGGTFTVTNLGMYGVETFTPIINPPEVAILGVGGIEEYLTLVDGQPVARSRMGLSLTIDHRVVDGAPGAAFLQTLVQFLEHPELIFWLAE